MAANPDASSQNTQGGMTADVIISRASVAMLAANVITFGADMSPSKKGRQKQQESALHYKMPKTSMTAKKICIIAILW